MAADEKVSKASVNYHLADPYGRKFCAGCVMFRPGTPGSCTLVEGPINESFVCDKWEAKPGG